jgi:hypothetical protein
MIQVDQTRSIENCLAHQWPTLESDVTTGKAIVALFIKCQESGDSILDSSITVMKPGQAKRKKKRSRDRTNAKNFLWRLPVPVVATSKYADIRVRLECSGYPRR